MIRISDMVSVDRIADLKSTNKLDAIKEMVELISKAPQILDKEGFLKAILERENIMSTGIGIGIAIPHAKTSTVSDFVVAIGRAQNGIDFEALDDMLVYLIIMIGASEKQKDTFLQVLAKVAILMKNQNFKEQILMASGPEEVIEFLSDK